MAITNIFPLMVIPNSKRRIKSAVNNGVVGRKKSCALFESFYQLILSPEWYVGARYEWYVVLYGGQFLKEWMVVALKPVSQIGLQPICKDVAKPSSTFG